jgi:endonuclease III
MKHEAVKALVESLGQRYSEELGISLLSGEDKEIFKWFLASILFGTPIRESSVIKTYKCFEKYNVLAPERILETGWDELVRILDEGGYTRYDFKTADKLLAVMRNLLENYEGSLTLLDERASDCRDLEKRLKDLGKGIGDVTVNIFLRELRGILEKANPNPTNLVIVAAKNLGIIEEESGEAALPELEEFWRHNRIAGKSFANFETVLLRLGKDFCKKRRCAACQVKDECLHRKAI